MSYQQEAETARYPFNETHFGQLAPEVREQIWQKLQWVVANTKNEKEKSSLVNLALTCQELMADADKLYPLISNENFKSFVEQDLPRYNEFYQNCFSLLASGAEPADKEQPTLVGKTHRPTYSTHCPKSPINPTIHPIVYTLWHNLHWQLNAIQQEKFIAITQMLEHKVNHQNMIWTYFLLKNKLNFITQYQLDNNGILDLASNFGETHQSILSAIQSHTYRMLKVNYQPWDTSTNARNYDPKDDCKTLLKVIAFLIAVALILSIIVLLKKHTLPISLLILFGLCALCCLPALLCNAVPPTQFALTYNVQSKEMQQALLEEVVVDDQNFSMRRSSSAQLFSLPEQESDEVMELHYAGSEANKYTDIIIGDDSYTGEHMVPSAEDSESESESLLKKQAGV